VSPASLIRSSLRALKGRVYKVGGRYFATDLNAILIRVTQWAFQLSHSLVSGMVWLGFGGNDLTCKIKQTKWIGRSPPTYDVRPRFAVSKLITLPNPCLFNAHLIWHARWYARCYKSTVRKQFGSWLSRIFLKDTTTSLVRGSSSKTHKFKEGETSSSHRPSFIGIS